MSETDEALRATEAEVQQFQEVMDRIRGELGKIIVGQEEVLEQILITVLIGGHCLITGLPGTAKTLMVQSLAIALGLDFKRIQFTPDLMPTDVTGTDIIETDPATGEREWRFVPGLAQDALRPSAVLRLALQGREPGSFAPSLECLWRVLRGSRYGLRRHSRLFACVSVSRGLRGYL